MSKLRTTESSAKPVPAAAPAAAPASTTSIAIARTAVALPDIPTGRATSLPSMHSNEFRLYRNELFEGEDEDEDDGSDAEGGSLNVEVDGDGGFFDD